MMKSMHHMKPLGWGFAYTANFCYLYNRKDYGEFDIIHGWELNDDVSREIAEVRKLFNEEVTRKQKRRSPQFFNAWDALRRARRAVDRDNPITYANGQTTAIAGRLDGGVWRD